MSITERAAPPGGGSEPLSDASTSGMRMLIALGSLGHHVTEAVTAEVGPAVTGNMPAIVLCELALHGPQRPRDLLEATHLTSGGLTRVLDQLESLGLIERSFGEVREDRRASVTSLTPEGARTIERIGEIAARTLMEMRPQLRDILDPLDHPG